MLPRMFVLTIGVLLLWFSSDGEKNHEEVMEGKSQQRDSAITLFLCGDVMTGRGIDQVLPHSVDPQLYEQYVRDARDYVRLAEKENGPIDQPVSYTYIWGDALKVWDRIGPDFKLINLETSVTTHNDPWPNKGIHYRMHPDHVKVLFAAGIDFCSLANNHAMDWGREGLLETLQTLKNADISYGGAGSAEAEAEKPVILDKGFSRVAVLSFGVATSGIPASWNALPNRSGVNLLSGLGPSTLERIGEQVEAVKQKADLVVCSIHWGDNWGYEVDTRQKEFAHQLIDDAGVDVVYGHSSHHPRGIEVYKDKLILYGAGDFFNDYEGIGGHEQYRGDLTLMYFPRIDPSNGTLIEMKMVPMQIERFRLHHVSKEDARWLEEVLKDKITLEGTTVKLNENLSFSLQWE